ncbi:hypothetical protein SAMN02745126_04392 [Enhydrobacter aerosaccus]|uniref:Uncharacterized protein n=1 Tax=Enhydrobacter aerosaccus TaxID=225324 RepID=A0A1T4S803_9HYPH|nr:hypothetical protein [Enhydrobacter aerosaccus]SKA24322.1 hypothetical protein SAMN02745126_04392 [Enhydrobacter aerosaccus]
MALDVYVGSLTRYYAGEWENVAEKAARERGERQNQNPARRAPDQIGESDRIRLRVLEWRTVLARSLGDNIDEPLEWNEAARAPYFTGRPGWDGFGSLVLWAAYAEHPLMSLPSALPEEWDNDPALIRSNAEGFRSRYSHLVRNVELWLPCAFRFTFEGQDVDGRRIVVGSVNTLASQLADLNGATWKVDEEELSSWERRRPGADATLELRARYAFAVMRNLARQALEHSLPMKLDY